MIFLFGQIILWLIIAFLLGFIIGWLLSSQFKRSQYKDLKLGEDLKSTEAQDDLKIIKGVGPVLEKKLNEFGITTFRQIAELDQNEIELISEKIGPFPGRIERDGWIKQAKEQHFKKYREQI